MPLSGTGTTMSASAGRLARELAAQRAGATSSTLRPKTRLSGPREVDVLEHALAHAARAGTGWNERRPVAVDHHQLARLDVAHVLGVDEVERAGLGGRRWCAPSSLPDHQRPEAPGVARGHQRVGGQEQQREGAHHLGEAGRDRVLQPLAVAARVEVEDDLGVGGGLEDRARRLQLLAQHRRVHQVAVVAERDRARGGTRSGWAGRWRPRCRPRSSSGRGRWRGRPAAPRAGSSVKTSLTSPMPFSSAQPLAVAGDDAGGLLARGAAARRGPR